MKLFFQKMGAGQPLLILHGLFGSGDNWQSLARRYAEDFEVYLIDQRNHGHSPHSEEHSYALMAEDLLAFVEAHDLKDIRLMGHSMGGKTAMLFCSENSYLVHKLIVADMAPKPYPVHHRGIVDSLKKVDFTRVKSRGEVERILQEGIHEASTRQFFMKNLFWKEKGQLAWRFNLPVLDQNLEAMSEETGQQICLTDALFIRGGQSNYVRDEDLTWVEHYFPHHEVATIPEAGHWLHAEAPETFFEITRTFMR